MYFCFHKKNACAVRKKRLKYMKEVHLIIFLLTLFPLLLQCSNPLHFRAKETLNFYRTLTSTGTLSEKKLYEKDA